MPSAVRIGSMGANALATRAALQTGHPYASHISSSSDQLPQSLHCPVIALSSGRLAQPCTQGCTRSLLVAHAVFIGAHTVTTLVIVAWRTYTVISMRAVSRNLRISYNNPTQSQHEHSYCNVFLHVVMPLPGRCYGN